MTKRQKFLLTSLFLAFCLPFVQFIEINFRYVAIGSLAFLTAVLTLWSLQEAIAGIRWMTTVILPSLFTVSVALFYFLLPSGWPTKLPILALFILGMYALLLTENIFSVAAIRTIQLFRAASAVGFLLTLLIAFFLYDTIFSFRFSFWANSLFVGAVSLPLFFHGLWSVNLEESLTRRLFLFSLILALLMGELTLIVSFYPLTIAMISLFLTTAVYVLLGLSQAHFAERLFRQTVYEYVGVGVAVLLIMLFTTGWGG